MTKKEIHAKVQDIFRDVFDDVTLIIKNETNSGDIEDWDSLANINLIVVIEKEFGIKFVIGEVQGLKNVGEMIDLIAQKTAPAS